MAVAGFASSFNYGGSNAVGISMEVSAGRGIGEILTDLTAFINDMEQDILPKAMEEALEPTMALSNYYAPVDTGELRGSAYVESRRRRGGTVTEIGYGYGGQAPYAVFVHEHPELRHEAPTQAKFLQRALDEDYYSLLGRIAAGVKSRARI